MSYGCDYEIIYFERKGKEYYVIRGNNLDSHSQSKLIKVIEIFDICFYLAAPEINILPVPDIVSGSRQFVPVTSNSCWSSVNDVLLKFENLPVIVTGRKRILSVTHKNVPDSDR